MLSKFEQQNSFDEKISICFHEAALAKLRKQLPMKKKKKKNKKKSFQLFLVIVFCLHLSSLLLKQTNQ